MFYDIGRGLVNLGNKIQQMLDSDLEKEICRLATESYSILLTQEERFAVLSKCGKKWDFADGYWQILGLLHEI
ncbi:MAG: hypothetical protein IJP61_12380 [Treponema sp.]|nr:hypothetical protein [Treponema sp.]